MDSVLLVFSVIDSAYLTAFENPEPAWYKALFPYFWHPFKNVATTCCAYMVVAIAAERYRNIALLFRSADNSRPQFIVTKKAALRRDLLLVLETLVRRLFL